MSHKVDAAICFDSFGIRADEFIGIWDAWQALAVNILLDPPLRFHPYLEKHPRNYLLLCCDLDHVEYVKKYFAGSVPYVGFMPHAGVKPDKDAPVYEPGKQYDVIAMGDLLEHVLRPAEVLEKVRHMLAGDGVLWISTPNYNCAYARMQKCLCGI